MSATAAAPDHPTGAPTVTRTRSRSFSTADLPPVPTPSVPIPLQHSPPLASPSATTSVTSPILSPTSSSLSASLKAFANLSLSPPTTLDSAEFQRAFHHARRSSFNGVGGIGRPVANDADIGVSANQIGLATGTGPVPPMSSSPTSSTVSDTLPTPPSSSPPKVPMTGTGGKGAIGIKVPAARQVKPSQLDGVCEKEELSLDESGGAGNDQIMAASAPASNAMFANGARWGWPQADSTAATGTAAAAAVGPTSPVLSSSPPGARSGPIRRASLSTSTATMPPMVPLGRVVSAGSNGGGAAGSTTTGSKAADGFGLFRRLSVGGFGSRPKPPSPPASTFGGSSNPFANNTSTSSASAVASVPAPTAPVQAPIVAAVDDGRGRKSLTATSANVVLVYNVDRYSTRTPHTLVILFLTDVVDVKVQASVVDDKHGGKMVEFAGWDMPLSYSGTNGERVAGGPVAEHHQVRKSAALFDVGHMVQSTYEGPGAAAFLAHLLPASLDSPISDGPIKKSSLSVLLNDEGGIIDDCMITRWGPESFYLVTNAGCAARDLEWISSHLATWNSSHSDSERVKMTVLSNSGLIALQGPEAHVALQKLVVQDSGSFELNKQLVFGQSAFIKLGASSTIGTVHVARGGYTGEDGFEISVDTAQGTVDLAEALVDQPQVKLAGLAARDSLRLEAGLCLYGHDLNEQTGVGEAALNWVVGKDRRQSGSFIGSERTLDELKKGGCRRKRIGLVVEKGAPAREGAKIFDPESKTQVGVVTSGLPSPTLGQNISMGYIYTAEPGLNKKGSQVLVEVRGKMRQAQVVSMPWIKPGYFRG
ncbi:Aminomethyltransferase, mitochondrial [Microbotryomycetes sp. JL201]|nr:Aminomethyltransferase, mitochondrial [Microbotryomycetes sp. JL201]